MISYRKGSPWQLIFRMTGSAIPRAAIPGAISACLSLIMDLSIPDEYIEKILEHPYPLQPFAYVVAFVLVFRTNVAYNRYWECAMQTTFMGSKWGDSCAEALTFDELPRGKTPEERAKKLAGRRLFQAIMMHRYSLMHALALQYLRRDDHLDNLARVGPSAPTSVPMGLGTFGGMEGPKDRTQATWQLMEVLGGLCDSEREALEGAHDRVGYIFARIMDLSNCRRADGGLGVDAPVLSRYYQVLSDGMLGFRQARKIEDLPFPWPYTQAVSAFLAVFTVLFPLLLAKFATPNCLPEQRVAGDGWCPRDYTTIWVGPMISFLTVTSYTVLHKVARALEDPFVHPPNDLPANAMQAAFNLRLITTWDALRRADDARYAQRTSGRDDDAMANSSLLPKTNLLPCMHNGEHNLDDPTLWEEWGVLESDEVRTACRELVIEWRQAGSGRTKHAAHNPVSTPRLIKSSTPSSRTLARQKTTPLCKAHRTDSSAGLLPATSPGRSGTRNAPGVQTPGFGEGTDENASL